MIKTLDDFPLVMEPRHMAQMLDVVVRTVNRRCNAKTMRPAPESWDKPFIWYRERLRAEMQSGAPRHPLTPIGRPNKRRRPLQRAREAFAAAAQPSTEAQAR